MVTTEYEELYPGDVAAVHLVYKTGSLDPLVKEYIKLQRSLEDLIDDYASQKARGKEVKRQKVMLMNHKPPKISPGSGNHVDVKYACNV